MATPSAFWVKIPTNLFESHDAFKLLETKHPDKADAVISLFVKMVAHAGKSNADGELSLGGYLPMGRAELPVISNRPAELIDFSVDYLVRHGLVLESEAGFLEIADWYEYVNTDAMAKIRESGAERTRKWRERNRIKQAEKEAWEENKKRDGEVVTEDVTGDVTSDVTGDGHKNEKVKVKDNLKDSTVVPDPDQPEEKIPYVEIIEYLNQVTGRDFKIKAKGHRKWIKARWEEGHTLEDFKHVVDVMFEEWGTPRPGQKDMSEYLRPETLFGNKFDGYRNKKMKGKGAAKNERGQGNTGGTGLAGFIDE